MSTKSNPGRFNCYQAAYPDETIFTILARDPAFPATVAFWKQERIRLGKNESEDDIDRLAAIDEEINSARRWRAANLDPFGDGTPTWKLPHTVPEGKPIRVEPAAMEVSVKSALLGIVEMLNAAVSDTARHEAKLAAIRRIHEITDAIDDNVPCIPSNWDVEYDPTPAPMAEVIVQGLVLINGKPMSIDGIEQRLATAEKVGVGIRQVMGDMHRHAAKLMPVWRGIIHEFEDRLGGYATELGVYVPGTPLVLDEEGFLGTKGENMVLDSKPEDLAHKPEVPPHRFSQFHKADNYAYARGLEINPTHLPRALDAMLADGWKLVSLFGNTNSEEVGFIFERVPVTITGTIEEFSPENLRAAFTGYRFTPPKIEVHIEGMSMTEALSLMAVIECRMRWLPQDYEHVQIVGLIADDPEAAFDFTQGRGTLSNRKTLIGDAGGCTEFGRQQEP